MKYSIIFVHLMIDTFISEGGLEEYDDVRNFSEDVRDLFGFALNRSEYV